MKSIKQWRMIKDKLELSYDAQNRSFLRDEAYPNTYFMSIQNEKRLLLKVDSFILFINKIT